MHHVKLLRIVLAAILAVAAPLAVAGTANAASEAVATTVSSYDVSDATGVEGDAETSMTFTIRRSGNTSVSTTIHPYTQDVTATRKVDYVPILSTTPFTFAAGETTRTVTVQVKPDLYDEPDETFRLRLPLSEGSVGHVGIGIGTIVDDNDLPAPPAGPNAVSMNDASKAEGNSGSTNVRVTLKRTGDITGSATVSYRIVEDTATQGVDFTGVSAATVTFSAGQTTAAIDLTITGDTAVEPDESFHVELFDPTGSGTTISDGTGLVTILTDDFAPSYYDVSDATADEGDAGTTSMTFTITRSGGLERSTTIHPWTQDITTTRKVDYVPILSTTPFTFAKHETTKTVTVEIKSDLYDEPDETFRLRLPLNEGSVGHTGIGIGTIVDNDPPTPPAGPNAVSINDASKAEGNSGSTNTRLTLKRSGDITGSATVSYRTVEDTATQDVDFTGVSAATVTFSAGQTTAAIDLTIAGDTAVEPDENFHLELFDATGSGTTISDGTGLVAILTDDFAPSYYDVSDATADEGDAGTTSVTFTITRSGGLERSTTIHPWTQDITTTRKVDYVPILSTTPFTFAKGETTKTVTVQVKSDLIGEPDETLRLRLLLGEAGDGHRGVGIGTIADNDRAS